jgi:hypothetical protein
MMGKASVMVRKSREPRKEKRKRKRKDVTDGETDGQENEESTVFSPEMRKTRARPQMKIHSKAREVVKRAYSRHVPSSHPDGKEECGEPPCGEFIGEGAEGALNLVETKDDVVLAKKVL